MQRKELRIIIVDDDPVIGRAIKEALTRSGYSAIHFTHPEKALEHVRSETAHAAIIDWMLPKINGFDLVEDLVKNVGRPIPVILISGICKSKALIREALRITQAITFLQKPFNLNELVEIFNKHFEALIEEPVEPIYQLLTQVRPSRRDIRKAVESMDVINGFELPFIYTILMSSGVSGNLNILSDRGDVSGIRFHLGKIVEVDTGDASSYTVNLLLERGFVSSDDIKKIDLGKQQRRIGERLIEANLVSPHALDIVLAEQMSLRLSKIIRENSLKVNFAEIDTPDLSPSLNTEAVTPYLHDWITSKLTVSWMKSFYMQWLDRVIKEGPSLEFSSPLLKMPLLARLPGFLKDLLSGLTLQQFINQKKYREDDIYRGVHLLLLRRFIIFDEATNKINQMDQIHRLKKMHQDLSGKDHLEALNMLGISQDASPAEVTKAYKQFCKIFHPDKIPQDSPAELITVANEVFSKISDAHAVLSNTDKRKQYLLTLEKRDKEKFLKAGLLFEEGKALLQKNQTPKALQLFNEALKLSPQNIEIKLFRLGATVKNTMSIPPVKRGPLLESLEEEFSQIPPEDRYSGYYFLFRGFFYKASETPTLAKKNFEQAVSSDPQLLEARRELNYIALQTKNKASVNIFTGDLKDIVGMLFKKR